MALNRFVAIDGSDEKVPALPDVIEVINTRLTSDVADTTTKDVAKGDPEYADAAIQWMFVRGFMPADEPTLKELEVDEPNISGNPISDDEVERGARVTNKAIKAELEIWGDIPELEAYTDVEL